MKNKNSPQRRGRPCGGAPELRVVEINHNPGPDAEDRLRRLFTILLRYAAEDAKRQPPTNPSPEDGGEEDGSCGPLIP